ncbi:MAG: hypothetical protein ACTSPW_13050 [Promethearchaeota archaeon]
MNILRFMILIICLFSQMLLAEEYHVGKYGNDSIGDGSKENPWLTLRYAFSQMQISDTLTIHAGIYHESNLKVTWYGTSQRPAVIRNYNNEEVIIDGGLGNESKDAVIEIDEDRDGNAVRHLIIEGLKITGGGGYETGNIKVGEDTYCENIVIRNCELWHGGSGAGHYNPAIITFKHSINSLIENCVIYGDGVGNNDRGGIKIWRHNRNLIIRNNEIFGLDRKGIDNKHGSSDQNLVIQYNFIHDIGGIGILINADNSIVEHNVLYNVGLSYKNGSIVVYYEAGFPGGSGTIISHNTILNGKMGIILDHGNSTNLKNCIVRDNIIAESRSSYVPELSIATYLNGSYDHNHTIDYNCYFNSNFSEVIREFEKLYSLSDWQAHSNQDYHSIQEDPKFENNSGKYEEILDFKVSPNSSASRAASDGTDMGANVFLVGPFNSGRDKPKKPNIIKITR